MTKIYAHRGYSALYPENTMLAFKKALEVGAVGIETDLQLTKDGEVVICHDEDILRHTGRRGLIRDLELSFLKSLSFHTGFDEYKDLLDTKIPTLRDFFEWLLDNSLEANLELKTNVFRYEGMIDKTLELIEEYDIEERIIISSFNHNTVREVKNKNPKIRCGFLMANTMIEPENYCKKNNIEYYHPSHYAIEEDTIESFNRVGIGLNVWTLDDENLIKIFIEENVHAIITNEVEKAVSFRGLN